jgi:hypothetical protein
MELHRQQCQKCKSFNMRNILVRNPGEQQMVYVLCVDCHGFVALYKLRDYYHHGKGIESYLRSHGAGEVESGRHMLSDFKEVQETAVEGFEKVIEQLKKEGKDT